MARVVMVTSRLPYPPREGHQLRSWHLLRALAEDHEVTLLSLLRDDDDLAAAGPMRELLAGMETFAIPAERSRGALVRALLRSLPGKRPFVAAKYAAPLLRARLAQLARHADVVHIDMLPLMALADVVPAGVPLVYNAHNVEHALLATRATIAAHWPMRRFFAMQAPRLRAFEQAACRRADLVLACSQDDAGALRALAPGSAVDVIANGVDLEANRPRDALAADAPSRAARLVFVGQMGWFPNRDGVDWFVREVLPQVVARRSNARFVLVGKTQGWQPPPAMAAHVELAGFVADLRPWVHGAALYVVPLRAGSGTRLKVLEAMALGMPMVSTRIGSEGIALRDGIDVRFADDAAGFADAVVALLDDPAHAARLGIAARACAQTHYGWEAIGAQLRGAYRDLLSATHRPSPAAVDPAQTNPQRAFGTPA